MTPNAKRLSIEIAVVAVVALIGFGAWWWCARQASRSVGEVERDYQARIATIEQNCELWAGALAAKQSEAVLRAFGAGVYPSLIGDEPGTDLDVAIGALLELPGVELAHLLAPDGTVIASSDRKFTVMGEVSARADWALGAVELTSRPGERAGTLELAAPILSSAGTEAIFWMGYATEAVMEECRPESLDELPAGEATAGPADGESAAPAPAPADS